MVFTFTSSAQAKTSEIAYQNHTGLGIIANQTDARNYEIQSSELVEFTNGQATIDVSDQAFSVVSVGGNDYEIVGSLDEVEPGKFFYDFENETVTLNTGSEAPRAKVYLRGAPKSLLSTTEELTQLDFIQIWNVHDKFNISRSLEGHPSSSITFSIPRNKVLETRCSLPNGKLISFNGLSLRIVRTSFTPKQNDETSLWTCTVTLQGKWQPYNSPSLSELDQVFLLKGDEEDCESETSNAGWVSYNKYRAKVGGPTYYGKILQVFVNQKTSAEATSTLRQIITQRAIVNSQFVYWSNPAGPEGRTWAKTNKHIFDPPADYEITSRNDFLGAGHIMPSSKVQLSHEYRNTEFIPKNTEEIEELEKPEITIRWEFERAQSLGDVQSPAQPVNIGDAVYILSTPNTDVFRDPNLAFDTGGFTKIAHKITEQNGVEIGRISSTYGWCHTSLDTYGIVEVTYNEDPDSPNFGQVAAPSGIKFIELGARYGIFFAPFIKFNFIGSAWTEIEKVNSFRYYDNQGYLTKEITTGKRLTRLKQDNSNLEGIRTRFQALENIYVIDQQLEKTEDPTLIADLNAQKATQEGFLALAETYRFTDVEPIDKTITYYPVPFSKYYSDITKPAEECLWTEPKFLKKSITTELKRVVTDNPASTDIDPLPPIVKGKWFTEEFLCEITNKRKPGRFISKRYVSNQEGEGMERTFKLLSSSENIGRPSQHQRKDIFPTQPPKKFGGVPANGGSGNKWELQKVTGADEENKEFKYLLNTPNSNPNEDITEQPVSFPDVFDINLGKEAAETKISMLNTKRAELLVIICKYEPKWEEGDRLSYFGKEYVILSINYTVEIDEKFNRVESFTVSCGRLLKPEVKLKKVQKTPTNAKAVGISQSGLFSIDGKAVEFNNIFNKLSPGTIANAIMLGVLDELLDVTNSRLVAPSDFEETDKIDNFLNGGIGTAEAGGDGTGLITAGQNTVIQPDVGPNGEFRDLRIRTPLEKYADLINATALLAQFNKMIEEALSKELSDQIAQSGSDEGGQLSAAGGAGGKGGPEGPLPFNPMFFGPAPNLTLLGGDNLLADLLTNMIGALNRLISTLNLEDLALQEEEGGAGQAGGAGGPGGGPDPKLGGSRGRDPVLITGDKIVFLEAPDINALIEMIKEMLLEAIALALGIDASLQDLLDALLEAALNGSGGKKSAAGGAGGAANDAGGDGPNIQLPDIIYEFIVPEIPPLANITINSPEADISNINLEDIFALLEVLANAVNDFAEDTPGLEPLDTSLLTGELGVPEPGTNVFAENVAESIKDGTAPGLGNFALLGDPGTKVVEILVKIVDISGVVTQGWGPPSRRKLQPWGTSSSGGFGAGGVGGESGGSGGFGGLTSGSSGGLQPGTIAGSEGSESGGPKDTGDGVTQSDQTIESSGAPAGDDNFDGEQGDFAYDGFNTPNDGYGDVPFVPGTNFTVIPEALTDDGIENSFLVDDPAIVETGSISAPDEIIHDPNFNGAIAFLSGATASDAVIWEFADLENIPDNVILETPYDLDLSVRFEPGFSGGSVNLRISLRGNPSITATTRINTSYVSKFKSSVGTINGGLVFGPDWAVDPATLIIISASGGGGSGISLPTSVVATWTEPNPGEAPLSYSIKEQQLNGSYLEVGTTEIAEFTFDVGTQYRIDSVYKRPFEEVPSVPFGIDNPPILANEEIQIDSGININNTPIEPPTTAPPNFYIVNSSVPVDDAQSYEGLESAIANKETLDPPTTPPSNFFTKESASALDDPQAYGGLESTLANKEALDPPTTAPPNFYEVL